MSIGDRDNVPVQKVIGRAENAVPDTRVGMQIGQDETQKRFGTFRHSQPPSPPFCAASGENSQRSGLRSISGVSSRQSSPRTSTVEPSMPTSLTIEVPIGLGRTGDRSEKVPRVLPSCFGLCSTRLRIE